MSGHLLTELQSERPKKVRFANPKRQDSWRLHHCDLDFSSLVQIGVLGLTSALTRIRAFRKNSFPDSPRTGAPRGTTPASSLWKLGSKTGAETVNVNKTEI